MALPEEGDAVPVHPFGGRLPAPRWALAIHRLTAWLTEDFLGGPRLWTLATVIDFQKGGTIFFLALLIWWYGNTSAAAWVYLGLHGGYGLVWLAKDLSFPDTRWQRRITIAGGINAFVLVLGWYWVFGWLLISRPSPRYPLPDPAWFALCIGLCLAGTALMTAADAQKHFTLRIRRGLITDGMFRFIRHPNYLGEMMIYELCAHGLALAAGCRPCFGVDVGVRGQHGAHRSEPVALPAVGAVSQAHVVAGAGSALTRCRLICRKTVVPLHLL